MIWRRGMGPYSAMLYITFCGHPPLEVPPAADSRCIVYNETSSRRYTPIYASRTTPRPRLVGAGTSAEKSCAATAAAASPVPTGPAHRNGTLWLPGFLQATCRYAAAAAFRGRAAAALPHYIAQAFMSSAKPYLQGTAIAHSDLRNRPSRGGRQQTVVGPGQCSMECGKQAPRASALYADVSQQAQGGCALGRGVGVGDVEGHCVRDLGAGLHLCRVQQCGQACSHRISDRHH